MSFHILPVCRTFGNRCSKLRLLIYHPFVTGFSGDRYWRFKIRSIVLIKDTKIILPALGEKHRTMVRDLVFVPAFSQLAVAKIQPDFRQRIRFLCNMITDLVIKKPDRAQRLQRLFKRPIKPHVFSVTVIDIEPLQP